MLNLKFWKTFARKYFGKKGKDKEDPRAFTNEKHIGRNLSLTSKFAKCSKRIIQFFVFF